MTREQFDKLYARDNTVINCKTLEEAETLLKMAHDVGYTWLDNDGLLGNTYYYNNQESPVYRFALGTVTYGNVRFSIGEGVLNFNDLYLITYPEEYVKPELMDVVKEVNNLIDFINNKIYNINNRLDNSKVRLNNIEVENLNIELGCLYNERRDLEYIKNRLMAVLGV